MPAPPGDESQLVDPPFYGWVEILCLVIAIAFSAPFVGIRLYTRRRVNREFWWDDWTCLLGWMFLVALAGLMLKSLKYGGGNDLWNVSKATYAKFTHLFHDIEIIARVGMFFTKASIVLLYNRLFIPVRTTASYRHGAIFWSIWFVFFWNLLYAIALVLAVAFECVGKGAIVAAGKQCVDEYAVLVCASVINVTTDIMILVIPIMAIKRLKIEKGRKGRLYAVFAVGILGVAASVARLGYQVAEADKPNQTIIVMILSLMK
ncbi:MAG: hypothetical protein M1821_006680 [Bathelium mastoideum]|nr:MAG: hypothetical protein M1821_006680 [Bathelium mastoideum]